MKFMKADNFVMAGLLGLFAVVAVVGVSIWHRQTLHTIVEIDEILATGRRLTTREIEAHLGPPLNVVVNERGELVFTFTDERSPGVLLTVAFSDHNGLSKWHSLGKSYSASGNNVDTPPSTRCLSQ